jgi:lipoprotein-anchoring transpeptidase ErfK/SrfK
VNGKTLYPKGVTEGFWVDKWMRTTWSGYGLHDAQWREDSEFGGDTYKENGSHGCINMPTDDAYHIYDNTYLGMPVIIY